MTSSKLLDMAQDLLFPRRCPICDRPVKPFGDLICDSCRQVPEPLSGEDCLRVIGEADHLFARGTGAFLYRSIAPSLYRFKFSGREEYADWYAGEMALAMARVLAPPRETLLVPVPIAPGRMRERGYNQSALLARGIAQRTGLAVSETSLLRVRETPPLRRLPAAERRKKVAGAFHACGDDVKSRLIMLIDDIYTTGATMDACAAALLEAGAGEVWFTVLAMGAPNSDDQRIPRQTDDRSGGI
jgi:ComF family protein